jgi:hypothetical protein
MKAIPMRGRLTGKKVAGYIWAGTGKAWTKKENYFQLESNRMITAAVGTRKSGWFWLRCKGATCTVRLYSPRGKLISTAVLALPHGRKR